MYLYTHGCGVELSLARVPVSHVFANCTRTRLSLPKASNVGATVITANHLAFPNVREAVMFLQVRVFIPCHVADRNCVETRL